MITANEKRIVSTNLDNSSAFSIEANDCIFDILSNKVYQRPIEAIERELLCNAIDADRSKKAKIHLPTDLEPYFYVEDSGCGMSNEDIYNVYTRYGASTKRGSNDFIGGLGIGSKTPFAYTDQFQIESSKDGKKNFYVAYKDEDNKPHVSHFDEIDFEQSGTKVSFPVKEEDFDKFASALGKIILYLDDCPEIVSGKKEFFLKAPFSEEETSKIRNTIRSCNFFTEPLYYSQPRFSVLMGGVNYEVDDFLQEISHEDARYDCIQFILRNFLVSLKCNIGDVQIQASREALNLNKKTVNFLADKIIEDFSQFMKTFSEKNFSSVAEYFDSIYVGSAFEEFAKKYGFFDTFEKIEKYFTNLAETFESYGSKCITLEVSRQIVRICDRPIESGNQAIKIQARFLRRNRVNQIAVLPEKMLGIFNKEIGNRIAGRSKEALLSFGGLCSTLFVACEEDKNFYMSILPLKDVSSELQTCFDNAKVARKMYAKRTTTGLEDEEVYVPGRGNETFASAEKYAHDNKKKIVICLKSKADQLSYFKKDETDFSRKNSIEFYMRYSSLSFAATMRDALNVLGEKIPNVLKHDYLFVEVSIPAYKKYNLHTNAKYMKFADLQEKLLKLADKFSNFERCPLSDRALNFVKWANNKMGDESIFKNIKTTDDDTLGKLSSSFYSISGRSIDFKKSEVDEKTKAFLDIVQIPYVYSWSSGDDEFGDFYNKCKMFFA